jgi:rare lipoprotein A
MSLKALLIVGVVVILPSCSNVEVKNKSAKLIPIERNEVVKIRQEKIQGEKKLGILHVIKADEKVVQKEKQKKPSIWNVNLSAIKLKKKITQATQVVKQKKLSILRIIKPQKKLKKPDPLCLTARSFQEGKASYYSSKLHGRKTASGETYNENKLTAAHKSLPFGTKIRVLNKDNGRSVLVSINDRGPFVKKRILDLSYFAAKQLGMLRSGISNIKMEILQ